MNDKNGLSPSLVETIAGFTAGTVSTLAVHPLDIVKTRLQVDRFSTSRFGNSLRVIRGIARNEGGIPAFYRGLTPNIVGNSVSWGLYFLWYSNIKDGLRTFHGIPRTSPSGGVAHGDLSSLDYFVASGAAGVLTAVLTNPLWVIKTRMLSTGAAAPGAYSSMSSGIRQIYRTEGLPGFYRGLIPALFGISHGALQFMAYEQLKRYRSQMSTTPSQYFSFSEPEIQPALDATSKSAPAQTRDLTNLDFLVLSGLSKVFAGSVTYPYQVLRARLQTYDAGGTYRGVGDAVRQIWRREGIVGFYKGLGPNLVRVLPSTWITFLVYENVRIYIRS